MTSDVPIRSSSPLPRRTTPDNGSVLQSITPADAGWTYVSFEVRQLAVADRHPDHAWLMDWDPAAPTRR